MEPKYHVLKLSKKIRSMYPDENNDVLNYFNNPNFCYSFDHYVFKKTKSMQSPIEEADYIVIPYYHGWFRMFYGKKESYIDMVE
jgi:hypothetical protein